MRLHGRDMRELTVEGLDEELRDHLQQLAKRERISLSEAALRLMRRGAGLRDRRPIGDSLDHLAGSWTRAEAEAFNTELEIFETIDGDWD